MKKLLLAAVVLGFSAFSYAQDNSKKDKQTEEITIRGTGDKDMNMTIQINGDSILVNGKPLNEFIDSQVTISKRKMIIHDDGKDMVFDFDKDFGKGFGRQMDDLGIQKEELRKQIAEAKNNYRRQWKKHKEEIRPFLGVTTSKVNDGGVTIIEVVKGSAAEKAGLKEGDIISKIDDKNIDNPDMLSDVINGQKPNDEVKLYYIRSGKKKNTKVTLGQKKEDEAYAFSFHGPDMPDMPEVPEAPEMPEMSEIPEMPEIPEMREHNDMHRQTKLGLKIQDTEDGKVKIIAVEDSSSAAKAGLKEGDIITQIEDAKINSTDDAREQLHPYEGRKSYNITVDRNGTEMHFEVRIPRNIKTADL